MSLQQLLLQKLVWYCLRWWNLSCHLSSLAYSYLNFTTKKTRQKFLAGFSEVS
jgi:hypothetical protein